MHVTARARGSTPQYHLFEMHSFELYGGSSPHPCSFSPSVTLEASPAVISECATGAEKTQRCPCWSLPCAEELRRNSTRPLFRYALLCHLLMDPPPRCDTEIQCQMHQTDALPRRRTCRESVCFGAHAIQKYNEIPIMDCPFNNLKKWPA